jgi:hypothetical protein
VLGAFRVLKVFKDFLIKEFKVLKVLWEHKVLKVFKELKEPLGLKVQ